MKRLLLVLPALLLARPAGASTVPALDLPAGHAAFRAGVPAVGVAGAHDMLTFGLAAYGAYGPVVSGLGGAFGGAAHQFVRLGGRPGEGPVWGVGLVLAAGAAGGLFGAWGAVACQPGLAVAWPLGAGWTLRAVAGPVPYQVFGSPVGGAFTAPTGWLPLVPNAELAWRLAPGHELTIGGLPGLVGWRGTL